MVTLIFIGTRRTIENAYVLSKLAADPSQVLELLCISSNLAPCCTQAAVHSEHQHAHLQVPPARVVLHLICRLTLVTVVPLKTWASRDKRLDGFIQ